VSISVLVLAFLDYVEFEYDALYRAANDRIDFDLPTGGEDYDVLVPGFSRQDLLLFDVTDPHQPVVVDLGTENVTLTQGSPFLDYTLSLRVQQESGQRRRLLAAPRIRFDRIASAAMDRDRVPDLFAIVDDLQVIAIGRSSCARSRSDGSTSGESEWGGATGTWATSMSSRSTTSSRAACNRRTRSARSSSGRT
jgi:hypothetical protein